MPQDYSEDQLIQRSTAELLEKELGWKSLLPKLMNGEIEVCGDGLKGQQSISPMATPWVRIKEITNAP